MKYAGVFAAMFQMLLGGCLLAALGSATKFLTDVGKLKAGCPPARRAALARLFNKSGFCHLAVICSAGGALVVWSRIATAGDQLGDALFLPATFLLALTAGNGWALIINRVDLLRVAGAPIDLESRWVQVAVEWTPAILATPLMLLLFFVLIPHPHAAGLSVSSKETVLLLVTALVPTMAARPAERLGRSRNDGRPGVLWTRGAVYNWLESMTYLTPQVATIGLSVAMFGGWYRSIVLQVTETHSYHAAGSGTVVWLALLSVAVGLLVLVPSVELYDTIHPDRLQLQVAWRPLPERPPLPQRHRRRPTAMERRSRRRRTA